MKRWQLFQRVLLVVGLIDIGYGTNEWLYNRGPVWVNITLIVLGVTVVGVWVTIKLEEERNAGI